MRETNSLDAILGDFGVAGSEEILRVKDGDPVTFWLPKDFKARYDKLQIVSRRQFSKKVRLALMELIELAEKRAG